MKIALVTLRSFIGARTAHLRKGDNFAKLFPALFLFLISAAVMVLQLKR